MNSGKNEQCWILIGSRRGPFWLATREQMTVGGPASVEFSPDWVIRRDEQVGDIIGFLHTHPSGQLGPSQRDVNTMRAWTSCLGRALLCLIACDEKVVAFLFRDDACDGIRLEAAELFDDRSVVVFSPQLNPGETSS